MVWHFIYFKVFQSRVEYRRGKGLCGVCTLHHFFLNVCHVDMVSLIGVSSSVGENDALRVLFIPQA